MEHIDAVFNVIFVGLPLVGVGGVLLTDTKLGWMRFPAALGIIALGLAVIEKFG